ncbi:TraG family protein [Rhodococcus sp. 06-156-3C]|uniref:type IV secretory system conjugative DNA transfer family protein n=1 Tax=Nocardiaceae TaxID=85025 RepID=UPI000522E7D0|nr:MULTISPECIES: TraM recognition domain-containing protein [Rhodococcus]OZD13015.1 TraG family protein [Rhodococcus sp. 06-156-4a]OZD17884.1 TraG family protein [Rhodococcus sp. 06-156-3C]OZD20609.1 TraG family protein [Rhodococcus sp. 06-156-4C]OZD30672.1 TraG family protein [Rhodococcus sp. 06-156-3b]OZD32554.1 TraG family protein [Rhodococcus sp. 06-156-3]
MNQRTPPPRPREPIVPPEAWTIGALVGGLLFAVLGGGLVSSVAAGTVVAMPGSGAEIAEIFVGLITHPGDPAAGWPDGAQPGPAWITWTCIIVLGAAYTAVALWISSEIDDFNYRRRQADRGFATRKDLARAGIDDKGVRKAATQTRASLKDVRPSRLDPAEVAIVLGYNVMDPDCAVYLKQNDCMLVEGVTGSGKTWRLAYQRCMDAPGPLLVTTTKVDLISATYEHRSALGEIAIFDPDNITGWPTRLRWSILSGCQDPDVAIRRAQALVGAMPMGDTKNGGYWEDKAVVLLRCYFHAAAVSGASLGTLRVWVNSRKGREPREILARSMPEWESELAQILDSGSDSADDMIGAASRLLAPLASPALMEAIDVPIHQSFDIEAFIRSGADTLYLVSKGKDNSAAPFVAALATEVHYLADRYSQSLPGGRYDPPIRFELDEVNNVAPIPGLPDLMSDSGGRGITIHAYAHNEEQNKLRWGPVAGRMFADNSPARLILPGLKGEELQAISRMLGDRFEWQPSGNKQSGPTLREVPIMTPAEIRTMEPDTGLLIYRTAPPILVSLRSVWDDKDTRAAVLHSQDVFDDIASGREPVHHTDRSHAVVLYKVSDGTQVS